MKKTLTLFIVVIMCFTLVACGHETAVDNANSETETPLEEPPSVSMEETIRNLLDRQLDCTLNILELSELSHEQPAQMPEDGLVLVNDERFPDYAAFEAYIRSIYSEKLANYYLNDFPSHGDTKYVNVNGALYLNYWLCSGKGYYVDWTDYTVTILSEDATRCEFTVTAVETVPDETPVAQEYTVTGCIVKESDGWRMDTIIC